MSRKKGGNLKKALALPFKVWGKMFKEGAEELYKYTKRNRKVRKSKGVKVRGSKKRIHF